MKSPRLASLVSITATLLWAGCGHHGDDDHGHPHAEGADEDQGAGHEEGDGHDEGDHEHDEVSLGTARIGELDVELAQGHGVVKAGAEGHLVVKLPYSDQGSTIVRAWLGTEDRFASVVGKGTYAASHDDYDVHAMAPDPLPEGTQWWIEIETPDGTKVVGSAAPLFE